MKGTGAQLEVKATPIYGIRTKVRNQHCRKKMDGEIKILKGGKTLKIKEITLKK